MQGCPGHSRLDAGRAGHSLVLLLRDPFRHRPDHGNERGRQRHLQQGQAGRLRRRNQGFGYPVVRETDAESERDNACAVQCFDIGALLVGGRGRQPESGRQQQFVAAEPRRRVGQLDAVRPLDAPVEPRCPGKHHKAELSLLGQPADRNTDNHRTLIPMASIGSAPTLTIRIP